MLSKKTFWGLKIALAGLILGVLVWSIKPAQIWQAFQSAKFSLILLALFLMPLNLGIQIYKWYYIVRWILPKTRFREAAHTFLISLAIGFTTPGRVGEYSRAFFVKGTDWVTAMGVVAIDKIYTLLIITAVGGWTSVALLLQFHPLKFLTPAMGWILDALFAGLLLSLIFPRWFRSLAIKIGGHFPQTHPLHRLIVGLEFLTNRRGRTVFFLSLTAYLIFSLQFFILINAFEKTPFHIGGLVIPTVFFAKTLVPISIADIGVREGFSVFLFKRFSISASAAFNGPILLFVINLLIPGLIGVYYLIQEKHPAKENR
ncbi:MAG: flippase-like domain-containing protein [Calditrichaeota bacterium]|nr:flippase-like domain-containing protein [Calditrichota bacterium]